MKRSKFIVLTLMGIFLLSSSVANAQQAPKKIAFMDLSKVFDNYEKTKQSDTTLEADYNAYEKERNQQIEKLQEAQGKLALLKEDEKAKAEADVEKMKQDLMAFDTAKRTDLTKRRDEKIREILLEIEKIVSDFAKKEKYDLILNDRVLVYGDETMDVTEQILKILNQGQPAGTTPAAATPATGAAATKAVAPAAPAIKK